MEFIVISYAIGLVVAIVAGGLVLLSERMGQREE